MLSRWKSGGERLNYLQAEMISGPLKGKKVYFTATNKELFGPPSSEPVMVFEEDGGEMLMHEVSVEDMGEINPEPPPE